MTNLEKRLRRLEERIVPARPTVNDELLRVAGKTRAQAFADLLEWHRQKVASLKLTPAERETYLRRIAESEKKFADIHRAENATGTGTTIA